MNDRDISVALIDAIRRGRREAESPEFYAKFFAELDFLAEFDREIAMEKLLLGGYRSPFLQIVSSEKLSPDRLGQLNAMRSEVAGELMLKSIHSYVEERTRAAVAQVGIVHTKQIAELQKAFAESSHSLLEAQKMIASLQSEAHQQGNLVMGTADTSQWPQVFITRVIGSDDLPDVEILTLPSYPYSTAIPDLEHLEALLLSREVEEFQTIGGSSIDRHPRACLAALHQVVLDAYVREDMPPWDPKQVEAYAEKIYSSYPVPVMNSPVSGSSLLQMVTAAGSGAAFMAASRMLTPGTSSSTSS